MPCQSLFPTRLSPSISECLCTLPRAVENTALLTRSVVSFLHYTQTAITGCVHFVDYTRLIDCPRTDLFAPPVLDFYSPNGPARQSPYGATLPIVEDRISKFLPRCQPGLTKHPDCLVRQHNTLHATPFTPCQDSLQSFVSPRQVCMPFSVVETLATWNVAASAGWTPQPCLPRCYSS